MTGLLVGAHRPDRPLWDCRYCGLPYPCPRGRDWLVARYGLSAELGRRAYAMLEQAAADLPELTLTQLWDRFGAWTEPVRVR